MSMTTRQPNRGRIDPLWVLLLIAAAAIGGLLLLLRLGGPTVAQPYRPGETPAASQLSLYCAAGLRAPAEEIARQYEPEYKIPVEISVYQDRSFSFITKSPPASTLLLKAAGLEKGSSVPNKDKVGKVTRAQVVDIAKQKMNDLNAQDMDNAVNIIAGTARSMGIEIVD